MTSTVDQLTQAVLQQQPQQLQQQQPQQLQPQQLQQYGTPATTMVSSLN